MESMEQAPVRVVNLTESDIKRVSAEIEARPEAKAELPSREVVRQALTAVLPQPQPVVAPAAPIGGIPATPDAQATQRVDALMQVVMTDGLDAAAEAASNEEPFVLDALHDQLTGAFHDELQRRGLL
jgi:hypothetical protein